MRPDDHEDIMISLTEAWAEQRWLQAGAGLTPLTEMPLEVTTELRESLERDLGQRLTEDDLDVVADIYRDWVEDLLVERLNDVLCDLDRGPYPFALVHGAVRPEDWRVVLNFDNHDKRTLCLSEVAPAINAELGEQHQ